MDICQKTLGASPDLTHVLKAETDTANNLTNKSASSIKKKKSNLKYYKMVVLNSEPP